MHFNLRDKRIVAAVVAAILIVLIVLVVTGVLHGVLLTLFIWPSGIVVGNLIASAMWQPSWFLSLHKKINVTHKKAMKQQDEQHKEHMHLLKTQHAELKQHITDTMSASGQNN
jgi:phosphotransferase system  glucose/maltose/N-acetylglucosamine-specific IIC component